MAEIRETLSLEDKFTATLNNVIKRIETFSDKMDMANYKTGQFEKRTRTKIPVLRDLAFNLGFLAQKHNAVTNTVDRAQGAMAKMTAGSQRLGSALSSLTSKTHSVNNALGKMDKHFTIAGFKSLVFGVTIGNALVNFMHTLARLPGKILEMGDTFILTQAKMAIATNSTTEALKANDLVYNAAQRSRSDYGEMAANVSKIGVAAKRYFSSTEEMVRFAETVSKSFTVAGATSEMRRNSTLQLIQALGSGKLQGDEFKSISEGAPLLLDALEKFTGIERGLLKEAGKEGKLTSDILKGAVIDFSTDIDEAFNKMPTTFEQACTQMGNKLTYAFNPILEEISKFGASIITDWNVNLWEVFKTFSYITAIVTITLLPAMARLVMTTIAWVKAALGALVAFIVVNPVAALLVAAFAMLFVVITKSKQAFQMFFADLAEGTAKIYNWVIDIALGFQKWVNSAIFLINALRTLRGETLIKPVSFVSESDKTNVNEKKWDTYLSAGKHWDQLALFKKRMMDTSFGFPAPAQTTLGIDKLLAGNGAMPVDVKGGKLDSVKIYEEDLVLLKDLAMREYQLNFSQVTPQMTVQFGDVHKDADVDGIVKRVNQEFIEALKGNLRGGVIDG